MDLGDQCPMYFDDGSDPYKAEESRIQIFSFDGSSQITITSFFLYIIAIAPILNLFYI